MIQYFIGIDLGTSAVKLLLVDEQGREDWWKAVQHGVLQLTEHIDKSAVRGIGVGGQMHGLVALDEDDAVIRPAILWNDGRTGEEVAYLNETIGKEKLSALTANIAFAGFTAPKLLWMRRNEPENFARIRKIMLPKDYINYRLTGVHSCDYSDASGMLLLDVEHKCWSKEMLEICGVDESWMPKLFESYEPIGTMSPVRSACRASASSSPARATTRRPRSAPASWARAGATSRSAPPARCSFPRSSSRSTRTTPCTPSRMPTAAGI